MSDDRPEPSATEVTDVDAAKALADRERFAEQLYHDIDPRLMLLLIRVFGGKGEHTDATIELTVVVDGTIISGSVVSEQAWARRQKDQIGTSSHLIVEALDSVAEQELGAADEATVSPLLQKPNRYIHFLGPVLVSGGNRIRMQATRVDLRNVSAWNIGHIPGD